MAAKHTKLLLAALALLLAAATTFAHADCSWAPNCDSCESGYKCDSCKDGYTPAYPYSRVCTSVCGEPNCLTCSTSTFAKCDRCLPGYTMNEEGHCVPPPCDVYACKTCDGSACDTCVEGWNMNLQYGTCSRSAANPYVPHCNDWLAEQPGICEKCSEGYHLADSDTLCLSGSCGVKHCAGCKVENSSTCDECENHYTLSEDRKECRNGAFAPSRASSAISVLCMLVATALAF